MEPVLKKHSKFLSLVLRHDPGSIGVEFDEAGWTEVVPLLEAMNRNSRGTSLDRAVLEQVVATNDKKRFEFSEDGRRIRARQGHSVHVELGNEPREPPEWLYHGTVARFTDAIRSRGLLRMTRHAVHLSPDYETASQVGARRGRPVVLMIRARQMHEDGHLFYLTDNGVWYTDHVPVEYLVWPGHRPHVEWGGGGHAS